MSNRIKLVSKHNFININRCFKGKNKGEMYIISKTNIKYMVFHTSIKFHNVKILMRPLDKSKAISVKIRPFKKCVELRCKNVEYVRITNEKDEYVDYVNMVEVLFIDIKYNLDFENDAVEFITSESFNFDLML